MIVISHNFLIPANDKTCKLEWENVSASTTAEYCKKLLAIGLQMRYQEYKTIAVVLAAIMKNIKKYL